jgi:hypothetical protein
LIPGVYFSSRGKERKRTQVLGVWIQSSLESESPRITLTSLSRTPLNDDIE